MKKYRQNVKSYVVMYYVVVAGMSTKFKEFWLMSWAENRVSSQCVCMLIKRNLVIIQVECISKSTCGS